jgi:hypothetical protein
VSSAVDDKKKIYFQKSDGARIVRDAAFLTDGKDGVIQYAGKTGEIDIAGNWQMQGWVKITSGEYFSEVTSFKVYENLSALAEPEEEPEE